MHPVRTFLNALARQALGLSLLAGLLAAPLHMPDDAVQQPKPERSGTSTCSPKRCAAIVPIGGPFQLDQAPLDNLNAAPEAAIPDEWYNTVMANIASSEYHINYQEQAGAYQSPNRKQDLRITYRTDGFELKPRVDEDAWKVEISLDRIGKPGDWMLPSDKATITTHEASLVADHGGYTMDYHNGEEGMRQNFVVRERPQGDGP
ncbi:MAG: hypothetical protein IPF41_07765, partial [Flavobacteriales bacterium]|nr:hypothetical protein [Flavobacteriales bacterium]